MTNAAYVIRDFLCPPITSVSITPRQIPIRAFPSTSTTSGQRNGEMALRRRDNPVISLTGSPEVWPRDDILAANSDTECEPLEKRRKHIDQIAQFYRDGGELVLISTTFRGRVIQNPWRRRKTTETENRRGEVKEGVERLGKRKRKVKMVGAKDGKVDRYFVTQKNSQERDAAAKNKKSNLDTCVVGKESAIVREKSSRQEGLEETEQFKAVPRIIDFDVVPQSTDIPSQNFPSLQLIAPVHQHAQPIASAWDDSNTIRPECSTICTDDGDGLFDAPTPQKLSTPKKTLSQPTSGEFESIQNLIGEETPPEVTGEDDQDAGLYDNPTPPPNSTKSPTKCTPPDVFHPVLPSSLTNRPPLSPSSLTATYGPLELCRLEETYKLETISREQSSRSRPQTPSVTKSLSHLKRRRSSSVSLTPSVPPRPPLERCQFQHHTPTQTTPTLNTQSMFDLANQSFNAIVQDPTTPLLPAATFTTKPPTPQNPPAFTPFRELNKSPEQEVSFRVGEESPLTYSPLGGGVAVEELWGVGRGLLIGTWNLDEEVEKFQAGKGKDGDGGSAESQSQSHRCLVEV